MSPDNVAPARFWDAFENRAVLVTGGFGFIGSNLVPRLDSLGAQVRILSRSWPPEDTLDMYGGARFFKGDIRDEPVVEEAVRGCDFIFHLAGKSGASTSNCSPFEDLDVNCRGLLHLLEAARLLAPRAVIVFPSSRLVYRANLDPPVPEFADKAPLSVYGTHKLAAENYMRIYHHEHGMKTISLRITNPYGPYQRPEQRSYGVVNQFIHHAVIGRPITLFGDGEQVRDYIHVADVVDGMLSAATTPTAIGGTFNIGSGTATSLVELASLIVDQAGSGSVEHIPWPASEARVETGDFWADISLIKEVVGWKPRISLKNGVRQVTEQLRRSPHLAA